MSIRPMDEQKCPVDIQMSIGHLAEVLDMYGFIWISIAGCNLQCQVLFAIGVYNNFQT